MFLKKLQFRLFMSQWFVSATWLTAVFLWNDILKLKESRNRIITSLRWKNPLTEYNANKFVPNEIIAKRTKSLCCSSISRNWYEIIEKKNLWFILLKFFSKNSKKIRQNCLSTENLKARSEFIFKKLEKF